jgi:hypothetical protein
MEEDYRAKVDRAISEASDARDKTLLTLTTAALGASIAFFHDVVEHPAHVFAIESAWGLFGASLVALLVSMVTAEQSLRRTLRRIDRDELIDQDWPGGALSRVTSFLNHFALAAFVLGLIFILVFAFYNVKGG